MGETWGAQAQVVGSGRRLGSVIAPARRWVASVALAIGVLLVLVPSALALTPSVDIQSASGPLTNIWIGNDLSCQISHTGDLSGEFYPPGNTGPADCGTLLAFQGELYGPDFSNHISSAALTTGVGTYAAFTAVSQSAISGLGTAASPFRVTTVGSAGGFITVTEVDTYVVGQDNYRTDVTVTNNTRSTASAILYHAADCYLQGSDSGYGAIGVIGGGPACTANPNDSPPGQVEEFSPITGGIHYAETQYPNIWSDVYNQTDLPNICDCTTLEDNTEGINWDVSLAAGASATYSMFSNFSPTGQLVGQPAVVSGIPTVTSSTAAVLGGTINPSGAQITSCQFQWGTTTSYGHTAACTQSVGAGSSPVAVSSTPLSGLTPGVTYHFRLVATNSRGTSVGADETFVPPLPPTIGQTADVFPVSGVIYVKPPRGKTLNGTRAVAATGITKGQGFVPLTEARQIPAGSQVDSRRGTLNITLATGKRHNTQNATLSGAIFDFSQLKKGVAKGLTTFDLRENSFSGAPSYSSCSVHKGLAGIARLSKKVLQTLRARDHGGKFRTRGRYSAATVRGTWWNVTDRCDGTLTYVQRGSVSVYDYRHRKTVILHAGHSYLAKAF